MSEQEPIVRRDWLSARELAGLTLRNMPSTKRGINMIADREEWRSSSLARKRQGQNGVFEYNIALLPQSAQHEIARRRIALGYDQTGRALKEATKGELAEAKGQTRNLNARQRLVLEARAAILTAIDHEVVARGASRSKAIQTFLDRHSDPDADETLLRYCEIASERKGVPSRRQLYDWLKLRDERGVAGLAPKPKGVRNNLPTWFTDFLSFYARPAKPTLTSALDDYAKTLPDRALAPSYDQVRRALAKLGPLERLAGREGKLAMRSRLAYVKRDTSDLMPTSIYVADGKTFDAEIAHPAHGGPKRPEITSIIDAATRMCVGVSADLAEKTFAVAEALRHACRDHGIPALFYTDRGPGYVSNSMSDPVIGMLSRAGITPMKALPYNSQAKGIIERLNQIYTPMAKRYPTYVGADMDKEARKHAYKVTRGEVQQFGASRMLPSWAQFLADLQAAVDDYNKSPHSALPRIRDGGRWRHLTPVEMWERKTAEGFAPIFPERAELDDMFRPYEIRVAKRGLIRINTNSYFLADLEAHDSKRVVVGYDNFDGSKVWVRELDVTPDGERPGAAIGIAIFEGNATRFVSVSKERLAMEERAKGRKRLLQGHMDEVDRELDPHTLLDHQPAPFMPDITQSNGSLTLPLAANDQAEEPQRSHQPKPGFNGRPRFSDDLTYARWILDHPEEVRPSDGALIAELIPSAAFRDQAQAEGIDLKALRELVRSVA